jgi:hypothetical protein
MRKGLARSAPAVAALVALAGCGPPLPLALMPDRSSRPKQDHPTRYGRALRTGVRSDPIDFRRNRHRNLGGSGFCVCVEISATADAWAVNYIDQLVTKHMRVDDGDVNRQRALALDQISTKVRSEALRVVVDGRAAPPSHSKPAPSPST